jgi:hypothetical protein
LLDVPLAMKIPKSLQIILINLPGLLIGTVMGRFIFEPVTDVECRWQTNTPVCTIRESQLVWQKKQTFYPLFDSSASSHGTTKHGKKYSNYTLFFVDKSGETQKIGEFKSQASMDMGIASAKLFLKTKSSFSTYTWQEDTSERKIVACFSPFLIVIMIGNSLKVLKSK